MSRLRFWKMSGAGNDFVVIDAAWLPAVGLEAGTTRALCDRRFGVGADGVLVVEPEERGVISVLYRNADGSAADFCGNGARCAARFAVERGLASREHVLRFAGRCLPARVGAEAVALDVARPRRVDRVHAVLEPERSSWEVHVVEVGVMHLVVDETGRPDAPLDRLPPALGHPPGGVNVTAYRRDPEGRLATRTLERGSGQTLACGSAALAVAALASQGPEAVVLPPAGIPLTVRTPPAPGPFTLIGEARVVCEGEFRLWSEAGPR